MGESRGCFVVGSNGFVHDMDTIILSLRLSP